MQYDYQAKLAASQIQAQVPNYPSAIQGGCIGAGTIEAPRPPVAVEIVNRMENIHAMLRDAIICQRNLLDRLHGPRPENPSGDNKCSPSPVGVLNDIENRLNWLLSDAQEIITNQSTLDRLA